MKRLNSRKEYEIRNQIKELDEQLKVEKVVSEKIRHFIDKKRQIINDRADEREKLKDAKMTELQAVKDIIIQKKEDAEKETSELQQKCEEEEEDRQKRDIKDQENSALEKQKLKEKQDMETAALYVQRKWNWFQTEGKHLAKKRKGKKGGKKGKKKK